MGGKSVRRVFIALWIASALFGPAHAPAADKEPSVAAEGAGEVERLNKEALGLMKSGKLAEAVAVWKKAELLSAQDRDPGSAARVDVLVNLGSAYYSMGSQYYPLAESYLDGAIDADPNKWRAYSLLGDLCYENGQPECAMGNYDLLLRLNPRYGQARRVKQQLGSLAGKRDASGQGRETPSGTRRKYMYPVQVEDDLPVYYFYLTINNESHLIRIDIMRDDKQVIFQSITFEEDAIECSPPAGAELVEVRDMNGDGFNDVKILCMSNDGASAGYLYYLFDRRKSLFMPFVGGFLTGQSSRQGSEKIRTYK